jgi:hypothetical protein
VIKRFLKSLPSMEYLKAYAWVVCIILLVLSALSYVFGRYMGYTAALTGGLIIAGMVILAFAATLLAGIVLYFIDPEE